MGSSSAVERSTVNRAVAGSNPASPAMTGTPDDETWIALVHSGLPPLQPPVEVNPVVRVVSNLTIAAAIGLAVGFLTHLAVPAWFALMCGGACSIVYCMLWLGSMDDSRNA